MGVAVGVRVPVVVLVMLVCPGPLLPISAEVYTSIQDLKAVFQLEGRVVDALTSYLGDMEAKLERIRK